jgi:hypothetical protein
MVTKRSDIVFTHIGECSNCVSAVENWRIIFDSRLNRPLSLRKTNFARKQIILDIYISRYMSVNFIKATEIIEQLWNELELLIAEMLTRIALISPFS